MEALESQLQSMNDNDQNITLTWNMSKEVIHFLDLEICNTSRGIETGTYFKATDCNSYTMSCHHRPWIDNIPRGQYMRIRKDTDFEVQSEMLSKMFRYKGYHGVYLETEK